MRTLIISTSVVPMGVGYGGVESMARDMAEGLAQAGHKVVVAAPYGSLLSSSITLIPTVKLPMEQDRDDIAIKTVYERGRGFGPYDIILDYSHGHFLTRADPNNPDWPKQVRVLPTLNFIWDNVTVRYSKATYNIGCASNWQRDRFRALYHQDAEVVPKWGYVDGRKYKPAKAPKRERFLFLGKLTPEKGAEQAVGLARGVGVGLDVVGGLLATDSRAYSDYLRSLADGKDIRFYFNVDESHKIQLIQNAKAVVYPVQFDESHNLVAIESAACGTPFVQYRRGALGAEPLLAQELGCKIVDTPEEMSEAIKTADSWFEPTKTSWTVQDRLQTYIDFFRQINEGLRW